MNLTGLAGAGGVTVTTRVSKRNYGLSFYEKFIQHHHRDQDRNWVDNEKAFMATNQMRWCLRKVSCLSYFWIVADLNHRVLISQVKTQYECRLRW